MKKSIGKVCIIVLVTAVVVTGIVFCCYLLSTKSAQACKTYCVENSYRGATSFDVTGDGRYAKHPYYYWIAENGDSSKGQEIFIFRKSSLGIFHLNRFKLVLHNGADSSDPVGSVEFFSRNDKGEKENSSTLLYYGSLSDSKVDHYVYTLNIREGAANYSGVVQKKSGKTWHIFFYELNDTDENKKKEISGIKFYDADDNLVYKEDNTIENKNAT